MRVELWRVVANPTQASVLATFRGDLIIDSLAADAAGQRALFSGTDASAGAEPWVTDGTVAGTRLLRDLEATPATASAYPHGLQRAGGVAYCAATDGLVGSELWRSDGVGAQLVVDLEPGSEGAVPHLIGSHAGYLYFLGNSPSTFGLWSLAPSRGAVPRRLVVQSFAAFQRALAPLDATRAVAFIEEGGVQGAYVTDGVTAARLPVDVDAGPQPMLVGGQLFFAGRFNGQRELFVTDGTAANTRVIDLDGNNPGFPVLIAPLGSELLFWAIDFGNVGLHATDGTRAGTRFIAPASYGTGVTLGDRAVWVSQATDLSVDLRVTDGTAAGTRVIANLGAALGFGGLAELDGRALVPTSNALWSTDGTAAGTVQLATNVALAGRAVSTGKEVAWGSADGLFASDGTPSGSRLLATSGRDVPRAWRCRRWHSPTAASTWRSPCPRRCTSIACRWPCRPRSQRRSASRSRTASTGRSVGERDGRRAADAASGRPRLQAPAPQRGKHAACPPSPPRTQRSAREHALQGEGERPGIGRALPGVAGERRFEHRVEPGPAQRAGVAGAEGRRRRPAELYGSGSVALAAERRGSGDQLVRHDAQREDIRSRQRRRRIGEQLRGHVGRRADHCMFGRFAPVDPMQRREAEVDDLGARATVDFGDQDVVGLQVAVHDPAFMQMLHASRHGREQTDALGERQGLARAVDVDGLAGDVLHRQPRMTVGGRAGIEQPHHVLVFDGRKCLALEAELRAQLARRRRPVRDLEGDLATRPVALVREVDRPHGPAAQLPHEVIRPEARGLVRRGDRHGARRCHRRSGRREEKRDQRGTREVLGHGTAPACTSRARVARSPGRRASSMRLRRSGSGRLPGLPRRQEPEGDSGALGRRARRGHPSRFTRDGGAPLRHTLTVT